MLNLKEKKKKKKAKQKTNQNTQNIFKYLGIAYLSHCLGAFVQNWQTSCSLVLSFSAVKNWIL